MARILITGSEGLIGCAARRGLTLRGHEVFGLDVALPDTHPEHGDIVDRETLDAACARVTGIVHLAAVSRVRHAEADPERCWAVNVTGTANVVGAALRAPQRPWLLVASSREVYGEPARVPVNEDDLVAPINVYGRSKAACEEAALAGRQSGLAVAILRLANVYGHVRDHPDRVVPAFCRAAAAGASMRVEGPGYTFDFTHVFDVVRGIREMVRLLDLGCTALPAVHLVSGRATRLDELAAMANAAGGGRSEIDRIDNLAYNVSCFVGVPDRARAILGWEAEISIQAGVRQLVADFQRACG
jgi:UDP-glucose 4-epimerase